MSINKRVLKYAREKYTGVMHTTLNPEGPGVVRIHMIPPKFSETELQPSVAIINGQDIIPVNVSWSVLLAEFIDEVNKYAGRSVSDSDVENIVAATTKRVRKVYPFIAKKRIHKDIYTIMTTFVQIARGETPTETVDYLNLGDYADHMQAPHRMDLMVSAMTKEGVWHCNQKCVHCYAAGQPQAEEKELTTDQWYEIIDRCRKACIPQLTFTGGEPTMRDDLPQLIDHAQWFVTRLNTNGVALSPELCKKLYDASLDSMQITFYSCDKEVHNSLVGADHFDDTVSGIENALAAGINLSINTPLCSLNKEYRRTLEFLHGKGVRYVTCSGLITTGNAAKEASESLQLTTKEIKAVLKDAVEYAYANDMEISFTSPGWVEAEFCEELGITTPTCGACLSNMAVTPSGNVVPCQSWLSGDILGNMLQDDWETIWNHETCVKRRKYSARMAGQCPLRIFREGGTDNE